MDRGNTLTRTLLMLALTLALVLTLAVVAGCGDDDEEADDTETTEAMDTETTAGMGDTGTTEASMDGETMSGAEVFANNCASCHGEQGEGDSAPALAGSGVDQAAVEAAITGEEPHNFSGDLPDEELTGVAEYVANEIAP